MGYLTLRLRGAFFAIATLGARGGGADPDHQLGLRRRLARRLYPAAGDRAAGRQLYRVSVPHHAGPLRHRGHDRARHRDLAARLRLRHDPRRRAGGRGLGRADPAAQADRHHAVGRASWAWRARRCPTTSPISTRPRRFNLAYAVNSIAMPLVGGTTTWIGPVVGAILLGTIQQVATVTISSAVNLLHRRPDPDRLRDHRAQRPGRPGPGLVSQGGQVMAASLLEVDDLTKRFGGFVALENIDLIGRAGRAPRPDRAERLGQEHAGQLHLRHAAERDRLGALRRHADRRAQDARAHLARDRAQLPAAAPVHQHDGRRQSAHPADLHGRDAGQVAALAGASSSERCAELLKLVGLEGKARQMAARPHPGGDAQARARARHGGRAQAPDRRRGHGGPVPFRGDRHRLACSSGSTSAASPSS